MHLTAYLSLKVFDSTKSVHQWMLSTFSHYTTCNLSHQTYACTWRASVQLYKTLQRAKNIPRPSLQYGLFQVPLVPQEALKLWLSTLGHNFSVHTEKLGVDVPPSPVCHYIPDAINSLCTYNHMVPDDPNLKGLAPTYPNNADRLARKWQVSIFKSLVWRSQGSNPRSIKITFWQHQ